MTTPTDSPSQREFRCEHCSGLIRVPIDLPPTTAPCPHCGQETTSPGNGDGPLESQEPKPDKPHVEFPSASDENALSGQDTSERQVNDTPEDGIGAEVLPGRKTPFIPAAITMICVVLVLAAILAFLLIRKRDAANQTTQPSELDKQENYIRTGWKNEAFEVLGKFIAAESVEEKLPHVLNAERLEEKMREFYGNSPVLDMDTPAEAFSIYNLPEQDRRNGMYMLVFDQPPQLDMRNFFRPVASLEVQYGLEDAGFLLSAMAQFSNFSMEPVRVHALFKMTDDGLKLDWEVFTQTKYRRLRDFIDSEEVGRTEVFRVFINEDVPTRGNISADSRTYRIVDPANMDDSARVKVLLDTKTANELAILNWVGIQGAREYSRTATIELEWRPGDFEPYLSIKRFICWEYLGLGGKEIPPDETDDTDPAPEEKSPEDS